MIVAHKHYGSFKQRGGIVEMLKDMGMITPKLAQKISVNMQLCDKCENLANYCMPLKNSDSIIHDHFIWQLTSQYTVI